MSRDSQQLARAAAPLVKLVQKKLGVAGVLGLIVAAVLYVVVLQPLVAKKLGVALPSLVDVADSPATTLPPTPPAAAKKTPTPATRVDGDDLAGLLTEVGRDTYRSPAGLRYTRGSQHGTRLAHLMSHTYDDPDRVGQHGVYDATDPATVVLLVDEAYRQALAGKKVRTEREGDQTVYTIDMGRRIGYVGGQSGNRRGKPPAGHLRLVVQGDRLITAFPLRP